MGKDLIGGERLGGWLLSHGPRVAAILAVSVLFLLICRYGLRLLIRFYLRGEEEGSEKEKRVQTISRILNVVVYFLAVLTGMMMLLSEFGLDLKPVLASLGIGGLAVGFGAQNLVKDLIGGIFILLEDQIRAGDVVDIGGYKGQVEVVGLRVLVLRDLSGNRIIIPNGEIKQVINMTYQFSRYVFDLGVSYKEDVDRVFAVIRQVGDELRADPSFGPLIVEPLEIFGLDRFEDSAVIIKGRLTTKPLQQWIVGREFNRRIKIAFNQAGIEIPFPQRTITFAKADPKKSWNKREENPAGT